MFNFKIKERIIVIIIALIMGYIISLFTLINIVPLTIGVIIHQIIDGIIAYFRFK